MFIYSIKNEKLNFFNRPIYCESPNEAMSYIQNVLMSDADRALSGLKEDLALYELGSIDFVSGIIDGYAQPLYVMPLVEIFNTIPADRVPRSEADLRKLIQELDCRIDSAIANYQDILSNHVNRIDFIERHAKFKK